MKVELVLSLLKGEYSVCRFNKETDLPMWISDSGFFSVTKTDDELSIVCDTACVPKGAIQEKEWKILKIEGPLDFGLVGILSSVSGVLADKSISIFAISTYDTDYILVKQQNLKLAIESLQQRGYKVNKHD